MNLKLISVLNLHDHFSAVLIRRRRGNIELSNFAGIHGGVFCLCWNSKVGVYFENGFCCCLPTSSFFFNFSFICCLDCYTRCILVRSSVITVAKCINYQIHLEIISAYERNNSGNANKDNIISLK